MGTFKGTFRGDYAPRASDKNSVFSLWDQTNRNQRPQKRPGELLKSVFFFVTSLFFNHKTIQQLIVLEVLRPGEYDGQLRHISAVLFGLNFIKFHGLGPEL